MRNRAKMIAALLRRDDGSNMVELAITSTVLFALLIGICQTSLALYDYQFTADAARQATRYAMVRGSTSCANTPSLTNCNASDTQIRTYVRNLGFPAITPTKISVTTSWYTASTSGGTTTTWSSCTSGTCNVPGNLVKVVVSYPVSFVIPFSSSFNLTVKSISQMVISQ